jgi:WD40 repeat protein
MHHKDIFSKMKVKDFTGHRKKVSTLDWNCTGEMLASASEDETIRLWNLINSKGLDKKTSIKAHNHVIEEVSWHPTD